jgi:hypothetical protein
MEGESETTTTIETFFLSLIVGQSLDEWLSWPPDVFAVTSLFLKRTGAYICTVLPPEGKTWPEDYDWKDRLKKAKNAWYSWMVNEQEQLPEFIEKNKRRLEKNWKLVTLEDVRRLNSPHSQSNETRPDVREASWELCQTILELNSLADETCAGFGTPSGNNWISEEHPKAIDSQKALHGIANILLAHTGSLSRLPTHVARVLPKLRTPSVGLTLRSLSHHLNVHETEVDIFWQTMPWVNIDENTINILVVPWPYEMEPTWFQPSSYATQRNSTERTRYFEYVGNHNFSADKLLGLVAKAEESVRRVHMIIFPELALTDDNLRELLDALASKLPRNHLPMVLTGLRSIKTEKQRLGRNSIVLSTFFAGKWYQMKQDKHHRWKLEGTQLKQYNLGGVLAGSKDWWEGIEISNRRLSILAPNNWLTLCPLICEDLARQEPVSEIIRGVGPTLLIAVLLDGPQLKERWPGRYASVMADDPGSSVLTVSSLGLAKRSISISDESNSRQIALWKDQISGWREITIGENKEGVVLTIAAHWREEFTADGRGDESNAAVFVLQGTHQIEVGHEETERKSQDRREQFIFSEPLDLLEISLFSYLVDAVLDSSPEIVKAMRAWVLGDDSNDLDAGLQQFRARSSLLKKIQPRVKELLGVANREDFRPFVEWLCDLIGRIPRSEDNGQHRQSQEVEYYKNVVNYTEQILDVVEESSFLDNLDSENPFGELSGYLNLPLRIPPAESEFKHRRVRVCIYGCLALLWAVHTRLNGLRRKGLLNTENSNLLSKIEKLLEKDHDKQWYEAMKRFPGT